MSKIPKPFDDYKVTRDRPINVELDARGPLRFKHLLSNPLYYLNAFQYRGGSIFRAIFGFTKIWDKEIEEQLVTDLDNHLFKLEEDKSYYIEELSVRWAFKVRGQIWPGGIKPKVLKFFLKNHNLYRLLQKGDRVTARINKLDEVKHVDIEFRDGMVMSCAYSKFQQWRKNNLTHEKIQPQSKSNRANAKDGKSGKAPEAKGARNEAAKPRESLASQLLGLRKAFRRTSSLRKVSQKT